MKIYFEDGELRYTQLSLVDADYIVQANSGVTANIGVLNSNNDLDSLCTVVDTLLLLWTSLMKRKSVF